MTVIAFEVVIGSSKQTDRETRETRQRAKERETYFNFEKKKTDKTNKQKRDTKRHK